MRRIIIYPGRFQPFGPHHYKAYRHLVDKFQDAPVYITTSNKTNNEDSPFTFEEKQVIITEYGIPAAHVIETKSPYSSIELIDKLSLKHTAVIYAVGVKDGNRLNYKKTDGSQSYFQEYKPETTLESIEKRGYVYIMPNIVVNIDGYGQASGTILRRYIRDKSDISKIFPTFDKGVLDIMKNKLQEASLPRKPHTMQSFYKMPPEYYEKIYKLLNKSPKTVHERVLEVLKTSLHRTVESTSSGTKSDFHDDKTIKYYHTRINEIVPEDVHVKLSEGENTIFIKFPDEYKASTYKTGSDKSKKRGEDEEEVKHKASKKHNYITGLSFKTPMDAKKSINRVKGASIPVGDKVKSITPSMNRLPSTIERTKDRQKRENLRQSLRLLQKFYGDLKAQTSPDKDNDNDKDNQDAK